ncbi:MAG: hypothetical protein ACI9JD_002765, partial [Rhodococcus sp. (in: high G+C Gram-positive bacteria)]
MVESGEICDISEIVSSWRVILSWYANSVT